MKFTLYTIKNSLILFIFISFFASGQQIEVNWGPVTKADDRSQPDKIIGKDATGFYILKYGKHAIIEKYSNDLQLVFSKELVVYVEKNKKADFENIYLLKDKIILFSSYYDKQNNRKNLFASYVSKDGIVDLKLYQVAFFENQEKGKDISFDISLANDSSRILIFSDLREKGKDKERFHYKIIDETFHEYIQTYIELPYQGANVAITDYQVDINNNIHMLYWLNLKKESKTGSVSENESLASNYYLMSFYGQTKETKIYDLRVGDNVISGIDMVLDAENKYLYIPGFYSEKSENAIKGTFITKIDIANKNVVYDKERALSTEFLALFYKNPERANHKTKDLYNYDTRFIYVTNEGELFSVSEQYYVYTTSYYVPTQTGGYYVTVHHYVYNHLIALKYNAEGDLAWTAKVPKYQYTTNDGGFYSSVATFGYNGKIFMIYNDNPKNGADIEATSVMSSPLKSQSVIVSIDKDGKIEKNILFKEQDRESILRPKFTIQLSNNEVVIYAVRGKNYHYGKLKLSN